MTFPLARHYELDQILVVDHALVVDPALEEFVHLHVAQTLAAAGQYVDELFGGQETGVVSVEEPQAGYESLRLDFQSPGAGSTGMLSQAGVHRQALVEGNSVQATSLKLSHVFPDHRLAGIGPHHAKAVTQVDDGDLVVAAMIVHQEYLVQFQNVGLRRRLRIRGRW